MFNYGIQSCKNKFFLYHLCTWWLDNWSEYLLNLCEDSQLFFSKSVQIHLVNFQFNYLVTCRWNKETGKMEICFSYDWIMEVNIHTSYIQTAPLVNQPQCICWTFRHLDFRKGLQCCHLSVLYMVAFNFIFKQPQKKNKYIYYKWFKK